MRFLVIAGFADSLVGFRKPLIMALLNKGLEVHVAAPELSTNQSTMLELTALGVIAHDIFMQRTGTNPIADTKSLFVLYRLIKKVKPDYVMGYTIKPVIYGSLAAWLARVPQRFALIAGLGYAFMDEDDNQYSRTRRVIQSLYKIALPHCQVVFFQNPDDELLFRKLKILPADANTCVVNGSGVDITEFDVAPLDNQTAPRFLLVARLLVGKGVREYASAAKKIKAQYPKVQFDLVGWIDISPNNITQAELEQWVADGTINFLGRLSDVRQAIQKSSVFVLPSYYREGTPRSILEAMAMGRAIITTDAPGCRETVIDGDNGFLVPIRDTNALVQSMLRFIEQPELIETMGRRSRMIAEEKYDVHKVNAHMISEMKLE